MIKLQNLSLQRGVKTLIDTSDLEVFPGQKVAIIGPNGCGKSSLFSLILGNITPDAGECSVAKHWQIVAISQYIDDTSRATLDYVIDGDTHLRNLEKQLVQAVANNQGELIAQIHEKLEHAGVYNVQSRAATILAGLGFSEKDLTSAVSNFSGGWQMRLNLARALLCPSDLLLLDEPTNHLDLDAVIWLQDYLQQYSGTLLLISHDQAFIDACANVIVSFEDKKLLSYTGNYSSYQKQRAERLILAQKQYEKQQQKKQHLNSFILRFKAKASKAKQAQSRVKQLEKMEALLPIQQANEFSFSFKEPEKLPNPLINMENVQLGYETTTILSNIHLNLVPGSRIGLLGRNGAGKSTLIKLLASEIKPMQGRYTTSAGLKIGYFAQHQVQALNLENSAFDHLLALDRFLTDQQIRDYLGGFGFQGDEALKKVAPMSGGEKARLVLALIVYTKPNLLLLDEPTNHLDMNMREALAYALQSFDGAMVIVSHDRYLLESVCDDFYLVDSGKVINFSGDLLDYQKWLFANKADKPKSGNGSSSANSSGIDIDRKTTKRLEAEFRKSTKPFRDIITKSEKQISILQKMLTDIENRMSDTSLYELENKKQLNAVLVEQLDTKCKLEEYEVNWLEAQEQLELAQAEFEQSVEGVGYLEANSTISETEFWQYSLQFYGKNNNQSILLSLQDEAGLNVNTVLLLMYLKTKNFVISFNIFNSLVESIHNLDSLTSNIRDKRRSLKAAHLVKSRNDFRTEDYQALLRKELDLEKQQQQRLIAEVISLSEQHPTETNFKEWANIDIKYYLVNLTSNLGIAANSKLEFQIDSLLKEQIEIANTFGLHINE